MRISDWSSDVCSSDLPPSAELRPDQRDDQSLPPYEVLDPLLEAYVELDLTRGELIASGFDADVVDKVTRLVDVAEYKPRQSPLGPPISPQAFGNHRPLPITNRHRGSAPPASDRPPPPAGALDPTA